MKRSLHALFYVLALAALSGLGHAQSTAARISGSVQDSTGAAVEGADVVAVNDATGFRIKVASNERGQYVLYPLPAGSYDLAAQKKGFRAVHINGIRLDLNDTVVHNFALDVGALQQEVTVSATTVPIINQTASVESTITTQQTSDLPLNGRSFDDLVLLTAGSADNRAPTARAGPIRDLMPSMATAAMAITSWWTASPIPILSSPRPRRRFRSTPSSSSK